MAILAGKVKILNQSGTSESTLGYTGTSTAHNNPAMTGVYSLILEIDGRTISLTRYSPIVIILDGDEVVVGGKVGDDGIFHATAFENITRGIRGNKSMRAYMPLITGGCVATVGFFWFVALVLLRDVSEFFGIAVAMTILILGMDWYARDYNRKMTNDAIEVDDYAKGLVNLQL